MGLEILCFASFLSKRLLLPFSFLDTFSFLDMNLDGINLIPIKINLSFNLLAHSGIESKSEKCINHY